MKSRCFLYLPVCFSLLALLLSHPLPTLAQAEEAELKLSLSRDFGYASGTGDIQGTFSMHASGPENLAKVEFIIDGEVVYTDNEEPFRFQFSTDVYQPGTHTMSAVGYTQDGVSLQSNQYQRNFVTAEEGGRAALNIVIPLLSVIFGLMLLSYVVPALFQRGKHVPLGTQRNYGLVGGTICPKCKRPFPFNFFSFKLIVGRLERCPHCGKWGVLQRYPLEMLRAAEAAELAGAADSAGQFNGQTEDDQLKKALDDSRYQDV